MFDEYMISRNPRLTISYWTVLGSGNLLSMYFWLLSSGQRAGVQNERPVPGPMVPSNGQVGHYHMRLLWLNTCCHQMKNVIWPSIERPLSVLPVFPILAEICHFRFLWKFPLLVFQISGKIFFPCNCFPWSKRTQRPKNDIQTHLHQENKKNLLNLKLHVLSLFVYVQKQSPSQTAIRINSLIFKREMKLCWLVTVQCCLPMLLTTLSVWPAELLL